LTETKRILFVCLGNIVRSPLAESLFLHLADQAGLGASYAADSAGTGGWHVGEPPDPRMRRVAARRGLNYDGRARRFERQDFDRFDLIIPMDRDNRDHLLALARSEADRRKVRMLRSFDPQGSPNAEVPDPYYGGIDGFEQVYQVIECSVQGLLQALQREEL
jgi:protein-tyrosine phosphatase